MVFIEQYGDHYFARITGYLIKQGKANHCRFTPCCFLTNGATKRNMHFALKGLFVDTTYVKDYGLFFINPE